MHSLALVPPTYDISDRDPRVQAHRANFGVAQGLGVPSSFHRPRGRYDWGSGQIHDPFVTHAALAAAPKAYNAWSGEHLVGMNAGRAEFPPSYNDWSGQHLTGVSPAEYAALDHYPDHYGDWCGGQHAFDHLVGMNAARTGFPEDYRDWSGEHLVGRGGGGHGGGGGFHGGHGFVHGGYSGWGPWGWDNADYPVPIYVPVPVPVYADDDGGEW